jgi:hypothetical protein
LSHRHPDRATTLRVGHGPRGTEDLLLADLDRALAEATSDPRLLATPILVVVPSRSLRLHLATRIVQRHARGVAGLKITTLYGAACAILERVAGGPGVGAALVPVLAQRFARRHAALRAALGPLRNGYSSVVATVRDLLDAGFAAARLEDAERALGRETTADLERARALLRVAADTAAEIERLALADRAAVLTRARDALRHNPDGALPVRSVFIHGFADATGVAADLLAALVQARGGIMYLDAPPDPADVAQGGVEKAFLQRFHSRMGGAEAEWQALRCAPAAPAPEVFKATGTQNEVREVARRIHALLDEGRCPERIAVVAHDLAPYLAALLQDFERLAVPFSAASARLAGPGTRRAQALVTLLRDGNRSATDIWLAAQEPADGAAPLDLRLALRTLGAARLADVAALNPDELLENREAIALPIRVRHAVREGDAEEEGAVALRRKLPASTLRAAVAAAHALAARLDAWPASAPVAAHLDALQALLHEALGWRRDPADDALAWALAPDARADVELTREEFLTLLAGALAEAGLEPFGGEGGGVQVLSVVEARARTFEHLFVLGLNRDVFPHPPREDPLLPDRLRQLLVDVLPDLPVKGRAVHEERYLFAQLLAAAEHVTLSFQVDDDDGRPVPPSPFLERLRLADRLGEVRHADDVYDPSDAARPRPAHEALLIAGLRGTRKQFADLLPCAVAETAGERMPVGTFLEEAKARLAVLDELDPDRRTAAGRKRTQALGPYFGFLGATGRHDPRRNELYVTTLESMAFCPWQTFLRKLLALEPPPDPLAGLPGLDPLTVGGALHKALEHIVRAAAPDLPKRFDEALAGTPALVPWPSPPALAEYIRAAAAGAAREAGWRLPMLARALEDVLAGYLEVARGADWEADGEVLPVIALEAEGKIEVADAAGSRRDLHFRVDRIERLDDRVRLTDYKSGTPDKGAPATQHKHLVGGIARGQRLQAAAYVHAVRNEPVEARYLYLRPLEEDKAPTRALALTGDDTAAARAFAGAVHVLLQAWDVGSFFPRLATPDGRNEGPRCKNCDVADACLRHDSGAKRRLVAWAARTREAGTRSDTAGSALSALWWLGDANAASAEGGA